MRHKERRASRKEWLKKSAIPENAHTIQIEKNSFGFGDEEHLGDLRETSVRGRSLKRPGEKGQKPGSDVNGMHGIEIVSGLFFQLTLKILYK